jgi:plasmid stabilization system protein ParE
MCCISNTEAGSDVALRFVGSVEKGLHRLEEFPHLDRIRHFRQAGLRSWAVPGFGNWLLFYKPTRTGIRLYRVIHSAMDLEAQLGSDQSE